MNALVLVTGSRAWTAEDVIADALLDTWHDALQTGHTGITVLEGGAHGADRIAGQWAQQHATDGVDHQQMAADWTGPCAADCPPSHRKTRAGGDYCPLAGHRRNQAMVDQRPQIVLAFQVGRSTGTADCIRRAEKAGIPVRRWTE